MKQEQLRVPQDLAAETTVVGCAIATEHGATLAHERLGEGHFYRPLHALLFSVTRELVGVRCSDERMARAAALAGVDHAVVERICDQRAVQWDSDGRYARRVLAAARARRLMQRCAEVYNQLGAGSPVEDVLALLQEAS